MTKIEALELELKARKMVENTWLGWVEVLRKKDTHKPAGNNLIVFDRDNTEIALGIIEGKPAWVGDKIYCEGAIVYATDLCAFNSPSWSWNPPKPKTVMVELLVADAEHLTHSRGLWSLRINEACRKALGK